MQQDEVIADFLRNFMGNDCQSSDDAEFRTLQEGCSNEDAIDKVMKGIADQNQQGLTGTARQLSKMQGRNGGATLKALTRFGTDYAATKYNDAWNRANADRGFRYNALANLSGTGQQAVNQITSTGMNAANNAGNLTTSGGAARAAGLVGSANAIGNGITGAGNSLLQYQMFNKLFPNDGTAGNIAKGNALMAGYGGGQDIYSF